MFNIKTLMVAALLSSAAVVSFAQAPTTPKMAEASVPAVAAAPADAAAKPKHMAKKHAAKKHAAKAKKASAAKKVGTTDTSAK